MKKLIALFILWILTIGVSYGQARGTLSADDVQLVHVGDSVQLRMTVRLEHTDVGKYDVLLIIPRLVSERDSLEMPSVGIYGRIPYYYAVRSGLRLFQDEWDVMLRGKDVRAGQTLDYVRTVTFRPWLETARVELTYLHYTCCGEVVDEESWQVLEQQRKLVSTGAPSVVMHKEVYSGVAHVDFVVNRIELRRDYHDNWKELDKISHVIDSISTLADTRIDTITLHGYASPEGPFDNNVYLAKNRVKALGQYLAERHRLDSAVISQQYTPEDWAGLRRDVASSTLPHRDEILAAIDDTLSEPDPDRRLAAIKRRFPRDYAVILSDFMPYLRHTDYTIQYTTDYKEVIQAPPPKLVPGLPPSILMEPTEPDTLVALRPLLALKTNMLLDLALWPNVEVEFPLGRHARYSIMAEWGSPWYVWHHNSRAYEILNVGLEVRRWLGKCDDCRPVLTGGFLGVYGAGGKYDLEWNSVGNQGEYASFGLSGGYSWLLRKCLNLELSGSLGVLFGPRRHYRGEFSDTHLIWKHFGNVFYAGPTQLKVSLVWLLPRKWFGLDKKRKEVVE